MLYSLSRVQKASPAASPLRCERTYPIQSLVICSHFSTHITYYIHEITAKCKSILEFQKIKCISCKQLWLTRQIHQYISCLLRNNANTYLGMYLNQLLVYYLKGNKILNFFFKYVFDFQVVYVHNFSLTSLYFLRIPTYFLLLPLCISENYLVHTSFMYLCALSSFSLYFSATASLAVQPKIFARNKC